MKNKICMVIPSFTAKGGITAVVNGYRGSKLEQNFEVKYIETYCDGNVIYKLFKAMLAYAYFILLLVIWKPEIVHVHSSFGGSFYRKLPFVMVSSWCGIPVVNHIHGSYYQEFYFGASKRKQKIVTNTYQKCARMIALSDEARSFLLQIAPDVRTIVNENFGCIHSDAISARKLKTTPRSVLFLGFISEKKGCFDIPKIVEIVMAKIPDVQFLIAGSGETDTVKKLASKEALDHIVFPGWVRNEEKDILLTNADIFFLPSYSEAMPMSVLEAMGYGLPIVSTNVGGIPKIVQHQRNGLLLEPGDINGMAQAIVSILNNHAQKESMGKESLFIVEHSYSLDTHLEKLQDVYKEL